MSLIEPFGDLEGAPAFDPFAGILTAVLQLFNYLVGLVKFIEQLAIGVLGIALAIGRALKKAAHALLNFSIPDLWRHLQAWYARYKRWIDWYRKHILAPQRAIQRNLRLLYDTFFRPVIEVLDTVRSITSIIGVFNRKLAAKIDGAIFGLEEKILYPFFLVTRRLNLMLSHVQAIITATGRLDADIFISSIERDLVLIHRLVTFNFGHQPAGTRVDPLFVLAQDQAGFEQFASSGTGPLADQVDGMTQVFQDSLLALGG